MEQNRMKIHLGTTDETEVKKIVHDYKRSYSWKKIFKN